MAQQKSTKSYKKEINQETGLTPIQEQAVILLLSGNNISSVASSLGINRSTIYKWQQKENFQAFYNSLQERIKFETESRLLGMYEEAIKSIKDCLTSENESVKLKAALWLIKEIKIKKVGETDPRSMIKGKCMENSFDLDFGTNLNEFKYKELLKQNNLE